MKLVKPKAEILIQQPGLEGIYKQIELAGRTCYKSEDKITEDSAKAFVDRMIKSGHTAMLEAGTVYLTIPYTDIETLSHYRGVAGKYNEIEFTRYSKVTMTRGTHNYVTTNYRVLVENNWLDDLKYLCEPTEYHERRVTFKLLTSIGVTRELNRHRINSIAEQSTRYCNYSKDKFGNEVTFCIPNWLSNIKEGSYTWKDYFGDWRYIDMSSPVEDKFIAELFSSERAYLELITKGWQPQQAREVLPLCTASEIVHTAFESDWNHFFDLRYFESTGKVHPNMKELTTLMYKEYESYKKEKRN
jgi:thymidylate synthase (FAD)